MIWKLMYRRKKLWYRYTWSIIIMLQVCMHRSLLKDLPIIVGILLVVDVARGSVIDV